MTLRSRLAFGLVMIALILVGPLVFAIQSLRVLKADATALAENEIAASLLLGRLREGLGDVRHNELALLFSKDSASQVAMDRQMDHVAAMADTLGRLNLPDYADTIRSAVRQMDSVATPEYKAALANDTTLADSLSLHYFVPALNRADSTVKIVEHQLQQRTEARAAQQASRIRRTQQRRLARWSLPSSLPARSPSGSPGRSANRSTISNRGCAPLPTGISTIGSGSRWTGRMNSASSRAAFKR